MNDHFRYDLVACVWLQECSYNTSEAYIALPVYGDRCNVARSWQTFFLEIKKRLLVMCFLHEEERTNKHCVWNVISSRNLKISPYFLFGYNIIT